MNTAPHPPSADPLPGSWERGSSSGPRPAEWGEGGRRPGEGLLAAVLILVATLALVQSWNRWLDPIIDTGRDLYIAEQLTHGAELYRDIRYQYPPLAPYALAALTAAIGPSLASFTAIGIAQSAAIATLLWFSLRGVAGFVAALFFVALSFTGASTWGANFVFPYAYAATIGMVFLLAALSAFIWQRSALAVALLVVASWCKIEYAAAAVMIVAVLAIVRRLRVAEAAVYVAAMGVFAGAAMAYFGRPFPANVFVESLTKGDIARHFFRNVSGFADWPRNLAIALASATAIALIAWLMRMQSRLAIVAVIVGAFLFNSDSFFRGWAVLQFVALIAGFRDRNSPLLLFSLFSVASTLRVALNVSPQWYGCALIVPVYALVAYVLFIELPKRGVPSGWWLVIVGMICLRDLVEQHQRFALKAFPIVSSRGIFYDANEARARILNEMIRSVKGPTLSVMPEGVSINYLTHTRTPLSFYLFTPPETADAIVEEAVLNELKLRVPAEVAVVTRDVSEYGFRGFGVDYDRNVFRYLIQNYRVERSWTSPRFQAILVQRPSR